MIDAAAAGRARDDRKTANSDARTRRGETGDEEQRRDVTDVDANWAPWCHLTGGILSPAFDSLSLTFR